MICVIHRLEHQYIAVPDGKDIQIIRHVELILKDVIETIDGKIAINKCMENPESCKNNGICKVQRKLYKVQKVLADEMSKITFQDVLEGK